MGGLIYSVPNSRIASKKVCKADGVPVQGWTEMTRAAIYTRVSTDDQAREGFSLEVQEDRCRAYCRARGWTVAGIYSDPGATGRTTARPGYARMLSEPERAKWDILLAYRLDRLHRRSKNFLVMVEKLGAWGKDFASASESVDTTSAIGAFMLQVLVAIAELESNQLSERVRAGMQQKWKAKGGFLGHPPTFGYEIRAGRFYINRREAKAVRFVVQSYLCGDSLRKIARELNRRGVRSKHGKYWRANMVQRILDNPLYRGEVRWDGETKRGRHTPLISAGAAEAVRREAARRRTARS